MNPVNNNNTAVSSVPSFAFNMNVSSGDLIAMGIVQIETKLNDVISAEKEKVASLNERLTKEQEKVGEAVEVFGKDKLAEQLKATAKLFKTFKAPKQEDRYRGEPLVLSVMVCLKAIKVRKRMVEKVCVTLGRGSANRACHSEVFHQEFLAIPASIKKIQAVVSATVEEIEAHELNAAKAQRELYDMDKHQRKLTARLTQQQLAQSPEGKKLVEGMDGFLDSMGFGGLPQLPTK
jgi:hypothetical protein